MLQLRLRFIIILLSLLAGCTFGFSEVVSDKTFNTAFGTCVYFPNGYIDDEIPNQIFSLEGNDNLKNIRFDGEYAMLRSPDPFNDSGAVISNRTRVPVWIFMDGKYLPVLAIDGSFRNSTSNFVFIPDQIQNIDDYSFENAKIIKRLTLPINLSYIGKRAFTGMDNLEELYLRSALPPSTYVETSNESGEIVDLDNKLTRHTNFTSPFGSYGDPNDYKPTNSFDRLKDSWQIPDHISVIGDEAYMYASGIESITMPSSLKYLGPNFFDGLKNIKHIYFRSHIPPICNVENNTNMQEISLHNNCDNTKIIGEKYFSKIDPENKVIIHVPCGAVWLYKQHPCFANKIIEEYDAQYLLATHYSDSGYSKIGNYEIALTSLEKDDYNIPDNLAIPGYEYGLSTEEHPLHITIIGKFGLKNKNCSNIKFPSSLKMIGDYACSDMCNIKNLIIPESVEYIGEKAFSNMGSLESVVMYSSDAYPIICAEDAFENSAEHSILYVDKTKCNLDLNKRPWKDFKEIKDFIEYQK